MRKTSGQEYSAAMSTEGMPSTMQFQSNSSAAAAAAPLDDSNQMQGHLVPKLNMHNLMMQSQKFDGQASQVNSTKPIASSQVYSINT
jgi:hypothetical protein